MACDVTLDLDGHALTVRNIVINPGQQLTIGDSTGGGILTANASDGLAGIRTTGASLTINGGTVNATGSSDGAGIGGDSGDGGDTTINGGAVNARGGTLAAGIGGGFGGFGGETTINGGIVNATGGPSGAGIGGGEGATGGTTTITAGTVHAIGGSGGAGIGGGGFDDGGETTITGGTVNATGNSNGAGIGGGDSGDGGETTIDGGIVDATGGSSGAGIGGGRDGNGGTTTITGGNVNVTGGDFAAGIGGGRNDGDGGIAVIGEGAVAEAAGGHTAVGAGDDSSEFGSLTVDGTLRLPTGNLRVPDSDADGPEVTVGGTGEIVGTEADTTAGAEFLGDGQVDNGGAITLATDLVLDDGVAVLDHHYDVFFATDGGMPVPGPVTVFAHSLETGARVFPGEPTRPGDVFKGWTTEADGAGDAFTESSVLPGTSPDGIAVAVTAYAWWATTPALETGLADDAAAITAGESATFEPTVVDEYDDPYPTDPADWTLTDADGAVTSSVDTTTGEVTLASTTAGVHDVVLTVPTGAGELTATVALTVTPAAPATLDVAASATTVDQGDSTTLTVTGTDEFANPTGDVTDETTFTSDIDTDTIDGNTIIFPTASVHTITATHAGGATATITVTVNPALATATPGNPPTRLPITGTEVSNLALTGLLLISIGLAATAALTAHTIFTRRRDTPKHLRT